MSYEHLNIYIVNGAPGAGKSTFEHYVETLMPDRFCFLISSVDYVKEVAEYCGWSKTKTPEDRKFLSELKRILTEWRDLPFQKVQHRLQLIENSTRFHEFTIKGVCVFIDVREPKEIQRYCEAFGAKSIIIRNAAAEAAITSNSSDADVLNYTYDIEIDNNGALTDLHYFAHKFIHDEHLAII